MNTGAFIGSLIDAGIYVAIGAYFQFFAAAQLQKRVDQGKATPESVARYKKLGRWFGLLVMIFGLVRGIEAFMNYH